MSIKMEDCLHGHLYRTHSRNLRLGVYNQHTKGFVGIRNKFGRDYLFTEYHWDTGAPHGTVNPIADLGLCPLRYIEEDSFAADANCRGIGDLSNYHSAPNTKLFAWLKERLDEEGEQKAGEAQRPGQGVQRPPEG